MKLSDWAKQNNITYPTAWRRFKSGKIPDAIQNEAGEIIVPDLKESKASIADVPAMPILVDASGKLTQAVASATRRNRATTIKPTDRFINIESGILPYKQVAGGVGNDSMISAREAILLCSKAYFNFSEVRSLLEYFTSVATGKIYFKNGNKKTREFFTAWLKTISIFNLQTQWYRERNRSGNCFLYRQEGTFTPEDVRKLNSVYGMASDAAVAKVPIKYIMLNPADIALQTASSFTTPYYFKLFNDYELACLKNPRTEADQAFFDSLSPKYQQMIKNGNGTVYLPLDTNKIHYFGYKKSDYEAFGISLLFSVLDDLEFYAELRNGDAAINRTLQQAVLLVTMGYQDKEGNAVVSQKGMEAMSRLFENESTARVVVSTFDTKMEFLVPDIADILDPVKYQVVRERIKEGLNNILTGSGEKFSNRSVSVQLFVQQIKDARQEFIEEFLQPEVKRISKLLGFKTYPEAVYEDINLKDDVEFARIVTRLNEIGTLTPSETLQAIETGKLPTQEESLENQEQLKQWKDKGWYQPVAGGPKDQLDLAKEKVAMSPKLSGPNGRPKGVSQPKTKRKITPRKASVDEFKFDIEKIKANTILASKLEETVKAELLKKHNISELNTAQAEVASDLVDFIMANEAPEVWVNSAKAYVENPDQPKNEEKLNELSNLTYYHQVDNYLGSILLNSTINA